MNVRFSVLNTPLDGVFAVVDEQGALIQLHFLAGRKLDNSIQRLEKSGHVLQPDRHALEEVGAQLEEYFAHTRTRFDLSLHLEGTDFQLRVWDQLRLIPYGSTISYGDLAIRVGVPNGARAIGRANGANPVAVVVPCHRVIGHCGRLTGYGGGIAIKSALLALEGRLLCGV